MEFKEFDKLVHRTLKNKWGKKKVERRDYRKLALTQPYLKGKDKECGLMFLVDITDDLYVDINLFENHTSMTFRKDDDDLITIDTRKFNTTDDVLGTFLNLIDEYLYLEERFTKFNNGTIPTDLMRATKIDSILEKL